MKYRDVTRKLKKLGCQELPRRGGGSHRKWYNSKTDKLTVLPDWSGKDLKLGTIKAVIKQLGIDPNDFEDA
jgi:mRNA interferase HicA